MIGSNCSKLSENFSPKFAVFGNFTFGIKFTFKLAIFGQLEQSTGSTFSRLTFHLTALFVVILCLASLQFIVIAIRFHDVVDRQSVRFGYAGAGWGVKRGRTKDNSGRLRRWLCDQSSL